MSYKKTCYICKQVKSVNDFHKDKTTKDGYCKACIECKKVERKKRVALLNPQVYTSDKTVLKKAIIKAMKEQPCADCGESYPYYVMDFDHVRGEKKGNIGTDFSSFTVKELIIEITKCDVVCSNCHRERTQHRTQLKGRKDAASTERETVSNRHGNNGTSTLVGGSTVCSVDMQRAV